MASLGTAYLLLKIDETTDTLATPLAPFVHYEGPVSHDGALEPSPFLVLPCALLSGDGLAKEFSSMALTHTGLLRFARSGPAAVTVRDLCAPTPPEPTPRRVHALAPGRGLAHLSRAAIVAERSVCVTVVGQLVDAATGMPIVAPPAGRNSVPPCAKVVEVGGARHVVLASGPRGLPFFNIGSDVDHTTLEHILGLTCAVKSEEVAVAQDEEPKPAKRTKREDSAA